MDTAVPIGTDTTLKCVTSSRVEKCAWIWRSLYGGEPEVVVNEFPSNGDLGRDCSLNLTHVYSEKQGHWSCQVSITSLNIVLTSPSVKLTVFEQGRYYRSTNSAIFHRYNPLSTSVLSAWFHDLSMWFCDFFSRGIKVLGVVAGHSGLLRQ